MSATHLQNFAILHQAKRLRFTSENQGDCQCPAHDDDRNSLHVTIEGDKLLLRCLAGCDVPSIIRGWGENRYSVLFARSEDRHGFGNGHDKLAAKIVATYDYTDADGRLIHQTVRFEPKSFRQRRPANEGSTAGRAKAKRDKDGNWWLWTLNGIDPVLYRLPEIRQRTEETIYIVEGEKDADNLAEAFGLLATTNPMGAAKWRKSYTNQLKGRRVVLIPDVDKPRSDGSNPGREHVQTVARALTEAASDVRIVELPPLGLTPKWDISDWIARGGTAAMLRDAVDRAKPFNAAEHDSTGEVKEIANAVAELDVIRPLPMPEITRRIYRAADNWPRRVGETLFVHEDERILYMESPSQLFGWLGQKVERPPKFFRQAGCHTKDEVVASLKQYAKAYDSVETLPHEPPVATCYYAHGEFGPSDNFSALRGLVSRFNPSSPEDADLIICLMATLFWGGPGGARPAFLVTSDAGRGVGKSTFMHFMSQLAGGAIEMSANEDAGVVRQRLLSPEGMTRRVVLLDNVKTWRFSQAELEAFITSSVISGKRMYVGEGTRSNRLTWLITLNGVSLSTDMAQRCVIIKLKPHSADGSWLEETSDYIEKNRHLIIGDLIQVMRGPAKTLIRHTRWSKWERDILSRVGDPDRVQDTIIERQAESDVEVSESGLIEDHFRHAIDNAGYHPDEVKLFIPSAVAAEWVNSALRERHSVVAVGRMLIQRIGEGSIRMIEKSKDTSKRGVVWIGRNVNHLTVIQDLITDRDRTF